MLIQPFILQIAPCKRPCAVVKKLRRHEEIRQTLVAEETISIWSNYARTGVLVDLVKLEASGCILPALFCQGQETSRSLDKKYSVSSQRESFCLSVPFSFKCNTVAQDSNHFVSRLIILLSQRKNICYSLIRPLVTVSVMETPCDFYIYIFQIQTRMPCTDLRQLSTSFN